MNLSKRGILPHYNCEKTKNPNKSIKLQNVLMHISFFIIVEVTARLTTSKLFYLTKYK